MAEHAIRIANRAFDPETLEVTIGDSVTWTNEDFVPHTATREDDVFPFDTGDVLHNQTSEPIVFDTPSGEEGFGYICTPHPDMKAKIIVTSDSSE